ncbi:ABC transporter ATP-binding protein [Neiella marina]|uniref:ABC transporter ATP-binding protein n=1 Tax=Neiella holothuriorum TaxID=2870530 RepID=A0ABS7ED09_9GAMM|nr:ABC transporter ATP-binding protein [Neiella holothuriorum]MBW8190198.1 ABC transporter ATP-binding protein [Neiella holothuriorum]
MADSNLYSIKQLSWHASSKAILHNIDLTIPSAAMTGIIGPNGAGKTSLIRCLNGFYQPSAGTINFNGGELAQWTSQQLAQQIALVSQQPSVDDGWTVLQLVATGLLPYKRWFEGDSLGDVKVIDDALQQVGLVNQRDQLLQTLSGGELQRALLAKALVQQPHCMLLDEPTNHLDARYQHQLMKLIRALPMTVVASIHDINLAAQYCDYLILLKQGQVIAQGAVADVFTADNLSLLFSVPVRVDPHPYRNGLWMNFIDEEGTP